MEIVSLTPVFRVHRTYLRNAHLSHAKPLMQKCRYDVSEKFTAADSHKALVISIFPLELLVPATELVQRHGLVPGVLVEVAGVRRALHLGRDGRGEAAH